MFILTKAHGFAKEEEPPSPKWTRLSDYIEDTWFPPVVENGERKTFVRFEYFVAHFSSNSPKNVVKMRSTLYLDVQLLYNIFRELCAKTREREICNYSHKPNKR